MAHSENDSCVADTIALYDTIYVSWSLSDVTQFGTIRGIKVSRDWKPISSILQKKAFFCGSIGNLDTNYCAFSYQPSRNIYNCYDKHWWRNELETSFLSHHFKFLCIDISNIM